MKNFPFYIAIFWLAGHGQWGLIVAGFLITILAAAFLNSLNAGLLFMFILRPCRFGKERPYEFRKLFLPLLFVYAILSLLISGVYGILQCVVYPAALISTCLVAFNICTRPWAMLSEQPGDDPIEQSISVACIYFAALVVGLAITILKANFVMTLFLCFGMLAICAIFQVRFAIAKSTSTEVSNSTQ